MRWVEFAQAEGGTAGGSRGGGGSGRAEPGAGEGAVRLKASFGEVQGCSFAAHHYRTEDLDGCAHDYELRKRRREEVCVRLDWRHHGIGSGSCGPRTGEQYRLETGDFEFEVLLE